MSNPNGYCHCGCGQKTKIATKTRTEAGWIKGQPLRYIDGHYNRKPERMEEPNPTGLCQCGCGQPAPIARRNHWRLGHVAGQPVRYMKGHSSKGRRKGTPEARFWAKVNRNGPIHPRLGTACWDWTGSQDAHGYGQIRIEGKAIKSHRFSYQLANGSIPTGADILHQCDRPSCCNPAHLFAGTAKDNSQDCIQKGRASMPPSTKGKRSGRAEFSDDQVHEFRRQFAELGISIPKFAKLHQVSYLTMYRIIHRLMYTDI